MTKNDFDKYDGLLHCKTCGKNVLKIHMDCSKVYKNGDILRCNVCEWIKRHNGIPIIKGYTNEEIIRTLHFFIYEESQYINDLACILNRTIQDTINLFRILKIGGKKCLVKTICEYCGEVTEKSLKVYENTKNQYCCLDCYWKDKTNKMSHDENSPFYNRIVTSCSNCGKEIKIIPYKFDTKNSFGDNHNFCCQKCYYEFRKKYYTGEKCPSYGKVYTDEQKEKMRNIVIRNSRNSERFNSKIQLKINDILDNNNIENIREYIIKYYAVDNYLNKQNLIIEVMGDYWHTSPLKYNDNKYLISKMQQKTLIHDKQKHSYIKNHLNIEILYLWETDINENPKLCEKLILQYINNNGFLENYHSFNWELKDDNLFLCQNLIIPYQDMKTNEYKYLFKQKVG